MTTSETVRTAPGLYLIIEGSDAELAYTQLDDARLAAPVEVVLLRSPALFNKDLISRIQSHNIAVLLEDDAEKVLELGADGVHLIEPDIESFAATSRLLDNSGNQSGDMIIGAVISASRHLAMLLAEQGASYIALFDHGDNRQEEGGSDTADEQEAEDEETIFNRPPDITWWTNLIETPCVAWNLSSRQQLESAISAGADFIALAPPLWQTGDDIASTLESLLKPSD